MDNLNNIDPSVVDRVEVVKGPAGGMLYGAQGANGVIQIFTKKGSLNGKLAISYNTKVSVDNILRGNHDILTTHHHFITDANNNLLDQAGNPVVKDATGEWSDPQAPDPGTNPFLTNTKTYNLPIFDHL